MVSCLLYVFFVILIAWIFVATRMVNHWFNTKYIHLSENCVKNNPEFKGLNRNDFQHWNRCHMIIGAIFILPIRFALFFVTLIVGVLYSKILMKIHKVKDLESELPIDFQRAFRRMLRFFARIILFSMGYHKISVIRRPFKRIYEKLEAVKSKRTALIVANHVSIPDLFYMGTRMEDIAFAAKAGVKSLPLVGFYARAMQCVFVNRHEKVAKKEALVEIQERIEKIQAGIRYPTMVIFPEGTVSNGKSIIDFRIGAFTLGVPVKVIGLKYNGNFNPCLNLISNFDCLIGMMMQFSNDLTVVEIDELVQPRSKEMTPADFSNAVREMMCEEFGLEDTPLSFSKFIEFNKKYGNFANRDFE
jgi:lysophosphatidylcholine acyltransferase/lyso-PAF acetyltransferase